jgi:hypothetical protein
MDDAAHTGVVLRSGVVVMDVHEPLEAVHGGPLPKCVLRAVHHVAPIQLGPAKGERHRVPIALGIGVLVEAEIRKLRVGQVAAGALACFERALGEDVADLLAKVAGARVEHEVNAVVLVPLDLEEVVAAAERSERNRRPIQPGPLDGARWVDSDELDQSVEPDRRLPMDRETGGDVALDLAQDGT